MPPASKKRKLSAMTRGPSKGARVQASRRRSQAMTNRPSRDLVLAPAAQNSSSRARSHKSTRYRESERIGTVTTDHPEFRITNDFACNPALASSFPWLSGHAQLYEQYRVHSLTYRYKNLKGTTADGNILMSFDYDTLDTPPSSAVEQTQSTVYVDGAPWRIFELRVPCTSKTYFTREGLVPGADLKTYDLGRLHVGAEGCDSSQQGILEVVYDIELINKQPPSVSTTPTMRSTARFPIHATSFNLAYAAASLQLDPEADLRYYNPLGIEPLYPLGGGLSNTLRFPAGWFSLHVSMMFKLIAHTVGDTPNFHLSLANVVTGAGYRIVSSPMPYAASDPATGGIVSAVSISAVMYFNEGDRLELQVEGLTAAANGANLAIQNLGSWLTVTALT